MPRFSSLLLAASCLLPVTISAVNILNLCVDKYTKLKTVKLNCEERSQIVQVDVRLGNGTCSTVSDQRCYGQTPSSMVDHFSCYWKRDCVINWPRDTIVTTEEHCSLVGSQPECMQISYTCFKATEHDSDDRIRKTQILDLCGENPGDCMKEKAADPLMAGIVRSHKLYPWDYPEKDRKCTLKIYFPVDEKKGIQKLVIRLADFDLSEGDTLSILTGLSHKNVRDSKEITVTAENYRTYYYRRNLVFDHANTIYVTLTLSVGTESNSGKGFVVCFKFINKDDPVNDDVCADITKPGNIEPMLGPTENTSVVNSFIFATAKPEIPTKCAIKISEKAKLRCMKKLAGKMGNKNGGKRNKKERKKRRRRKKRNNNRKKRHHHRECGNKNSEKAKLRCMKKLSEKMGNKNGDKRNKKERKSGTRRKKRNNNRRKRHHNTG